MKATRRTKIRLETHELKIVRFGQRESMYCPFCAAETKHLTVAETAEIMEMSEREVFRLVESEQLHSTETAERRLLICAELISKY
jgi:predicted DNA-binding protein (UPF0251 family)